MTHPFLKTFLRQERGGITVEWVVLAALLASVAIGSAAIHKDGFGVFTSKVSEGLTGESDEDFLRVHIVNGSFENVVGLRKASWGYQTPTIEGWVSETGHMFEIKNKGYRGADTYDGDYYLDMNESPGNLAISQTFTKAQDDVWYNIGLTAYDSIGNNALEIYYGGEFVGSVVPGDASWHVYDFHVRGGSGDGSNKVLIKEVGVEDNWGTYIDSVGFYRLADHLQAKAEEDWLASQQGS
ncbi:MAG: hypothetical protein WBA67_12905 [Jannaschia sp.]